MAPKDEGEMRDMMFTAIEHPGPAALRYPRGNGAGTWTLSSIEPDAIHPLQLDPDEVAIIWIAFTGSPPTWVKASTSTGASASAYV
jgi:deoxyxylulose-5-phosphate synthase